MFRDKFWLSFALTIPVVFLSGDVQHWFGSTAPSFPGSTVLVPILGTIIFFYGGLVFIRGAWSEIADRKPGMMTLISLGIALAFLTSVAGTFGALKIEVWWELATLTTIMILGHWLEMRALSQARGALNALAALLPDTVERVAGQETQTVRLSDLKVGDVVLVRPGTRLPADGTVLEGAADVDESMITGESRSVSKEVGSTVIAGTVASGVSLRVRVTAVGEQTALSGIMRLVARCAGFRFSDAGHRRPCCRHALLCSRDGRRDHVGLLVVCRRQGTCFDKDGYRADYRLAPTRWDSPFLS
jgi:Cu2+-exporting ATPase